MPVSTNIFFLQDQVHLQLNKTNFTQVVRTHMTKLDEHHNIGLSLPRPSSTYQTEARYHRVACHARPTNWPRHQRHGKAQLLANAQSHRLSPEAALVFQGDRNKLTLSHIDNLICCGATVNESLMPSLFRVSKSRD